MAKKPAAFACNVKGLVNGLLHVAAGFHQHFAHFAGHVARKLFFFDGEHIGGAVEDFRAFGSGDEPPLGKGLFGSLNGQVYIFGMR